MILDIRLVFLEPRFTDYRGLHPGRSFSCRLALLQTTPLPQYPGSRRRTFPLTTFISVADISAGKPPP